MKLTKDDAIRKLTKILRANTGTRDCGQFDQDSETYIEDLNELECDLTDLINDIYDNED